MKIEWSNIRDYRKVGEYEYLKVDGVTIGRFGKVKNRTTFHAFNKCGNMEWQDMETGWNLNCSALLKKFCQSVRARENLMNAEIAEAEAKRAEQDENERLAKMVHVVPTADIREHNETGPCWCNPEIRDGVVIHNSADGRENDEEEIDQKCVELVKKIAQWHRANAFVSEECAFVIGEDAIALFPEQK